MRTGRFSGFQFALPRGERPMRVSSITSNGRFNSRSRVGSNVPPRCWHSAFSRFNSRSRVGSDAQPAFNRQSFPRFNSRSRMGSDVRLLAGWKQFTGFNSRSRVGSDDRDSLAWTARDLFQFALPRGERRCGAQSCPASRPVSIRAPAWGATATLPNAVSMCAVSIRAPAWGATSEEAVYRIIAGFNSRSRVGSDLVLL